MPRYAVLTAAILASTLPLFAQTSVPPSGITLTAGTQLVVVDVVVEDKDGHPIHGLKASDFIVEEAKKPQGIKTFDEHTAVDISQLKPEPPLKLPPGTFTNFTSVPADSTLNVLLLDTLNTPMQDQSYVRKQLQEYVKHATPGTRVAIFGLTSHLILLQGFTSDPEILKGIVEHKLIPRTSPLIDDPVSGVSDPHAMSEAIAAADSGAAGAIASMQQFEADTASFQTQSRTEYTLQAFMQMARYLSGFPGRKNLIWFSGSFPLSIFPDPTISSPFSVQADASGMLRETSALLDRARVAVYPIDARGSQSAPSFDASNTAGVYVQHAAKFGSDIAAFDQTSQQEHMTMQQVAEETGGHAFYNTNGIAEAVSKALSSGSNFYTLTYSPSERKQHGEFRNIRVQLQGENASRGLKLAYRHGYYADDIDRKQGSSSFMTNNTAAPANPGAAGAPAQPDAGARYAVAAMQRGAPTPSEIVFKVRVLPDSKATEATVAPMNHLNPQKPMTGPFRLYDIDFAVIGSTLKIPPQADGNRVGAVEFVTYVYDADGKLLNIAGDSLAIHVTPQVYAQLVHTGLGFSMRVSAPAKGESFLRIAVHDLASGRFGVVEIPTSSVARLEPAPEPPPGAGAIHDAANKIALHPHPVVRSYV